MSSPPEGAGPLLLWSVGVALAGLSIVLGVLGLAWVLTR